MPTPTKGSLQYFHKGRVGGISKITASSLVILNRYYKVMQASRQMRADAPLGRGEFQKRMQRRHDGLTTVSVICTLLFHVVINMKSSHKCKMSKIFSSVLL